MNSIDIVTGQHVTIAYKPASVFERGFATVLDWIIQLFYVLFLLLVFEQILYEAGIRGDLSQLFFVVLLLPVIFYNFLFEAFLNGQTPGKMVFKIRVAQTDGSAPSIGSHFLRWLIRPADFFPFGGGLGMFFIFFTAKHQRIGDLAADTIVIKTNEKINIGAEYYDFDNTYNPQFAQVEKLSEGQIDLIRKFLDLPKERNEERLEDLAGKVKKALCIDSSLYPRDFLVRVVRDYYYYSSMGI